MRHIIRGDQRVEDVLATKGTVGETLLVAMDAEVPWLSKKPGHWLYGICQGWFRHQNGRRAHIQLRLGGPAVAERKTLIIQEIEGDQFHGRAVLQGDVLVVGVGKDLRVDRVPGIARELVARFVLNRTDDDSRRVRSATAHHVRSEPIQIGGSKLATPDILGLFW